jgi:hypothetical protein
MKPSRALTPRLTGCYHASPVSGSGRKLSIVPGTNRPFVGNPLTQLYLKQPRVPRSALVGEPWCESDIELG